MSIDIFVKTNEKRPPDPLCAFLRVLRKAAGLSLLQVEERLGIAAVVLGAYERGDRQPTVKRLRVLLEFYGYRLEAVAVGETAVREPSDIAASLRSIASQLEGSHAVHEM